MSGERRHPDTPEGLRAALLEWKDQENAKAAHNARVLLQELHDVARERGVDIHAPGAMERARLAREADASTGWAVRTANPNGRPSTAPPARELLARMRAEQAKVARKMSDTEAAETVGGRCQPTLSGAHVMKLTRALRTS